jgi:hypothetical protein
MGSKLHLSVQNFADHKIRLKGNEEILVQTTRKLNLFSSAGHNFALFVESSSVCMDGAVRAVEGGPPTNVHAVLFVINRGFEWEGLPRSIYRPCILPHTVPGKTKFTVPIAAPKASHGNKQLKGSPSFQGTMDDFLS